MRLTKTDPATNHPGRTAEKEAETSSQSCEVLHETGDEGSGRLASSELVVGRYRDEFPFVTLTHVRP